VKPRSELCPCEASCPARPNGTVPGIVPEERSRRFVAPYLGCGVMASLSSTGITTTANGVPVSSLSCGSGLPNAKAADHRVVVLGREHHHVRVPRVDARPQVLVRGPHVGEGHRVPVWQLAFVVRQLNSLRDLVRPFPSSASLVRSS